jgi:hypothetical protein
MRVFVELWNARPEWLELSREERAAYMQKVREGLAAMREGGIEVLGWGSVDPETGHKAGYGFYAVYRVQDRDQVKAFEEAVEGAGWYGYFEQINASGELEDPHAVIDRLIEA